MILFNRKSCSKNKREKVDLEIKSFTEKNIDLEEE